MFRKKTLRNTDYETSSQPSKESKKRQRNRSGGRNDSYASSSNTIDEIIRDEDYDIQSVIDVSRLEKNLYYHLATIDLNCGIIQIIRILIFQFYFISTAMDAVKGDYFEGAVIESASSVFAPS